MTLRKISSPNTLDTVGASGSCWLIRLTDDQINKINLDHKININQALLDKLHRSIELYQCGFSPNTETLRKDTFKKLKSLEKALPSIIDSLSPTLNGKKNRGQASAEQRMLIATSEIFTEPPSEFTSCLSEHELALPAHFYPIFPTVGSDAHKQLLFQMILLKFAVPLAIKHLEEEGRDNPGGTPSKWAENRFLQALEEIFKKSRKDKRHYQKRFANFRVCICDHLPEEMRPPWGARDANSDTANRKVRRLKGNQKKS